MDELTRLPICALAAYRLAEMIVVDDGPFDIFLEARSWLYRVAGRDDRPYPLAGQVLHEVYRAVTCVYCTGVWLSLLFSLSFFFQVALVDFFLIAFAIAGLQSVLASKTGR